MKRMLGLLLLSFNLYSHPFTVCDDNGMADIYPCENIDLMHRVHLDVMSDNANAKGSDIWGWTDPETGKEYALMTMTFATSFVDISDPKNPIVIGSLDTATFGSTWRDVKTYNNYAYIVSEAANHGMQVFDLTQLRNIDNPPVEFTATNRYTEFGSAHNIVINEDSGFAYAVGTRTCRGGLHMIDLQNPAAPANAGCFSNDGYTHDAQCVNYIGADIEHVGKEICFNSNEDTITIVDASNKDAPIRLSRTGYSGSQYTHQGWLTDDHRYYLMNDELDEQNLGHKTKTYIWDMLDIDAPQLLGFYNGPKNSIDHNLYIKGNLAFLTNYTSGLRIVDISDIGNGNLQEIASFDGYPANDSATFNGAWSNYPYFESGNIIMSDFDGGLFILHPNLCPTSTQAQGILANSNGDNSIALNWDQDLTGSQSYNIYRSEGGCDADNFIKIADGLTDPSFIDNDVTGQVKIGYKISKFIPSDFEQCESERSICVETQTTGNCTAAPHFSGISSANSSNSANCGMDINWSAATSFCSSELKYDVFKSTDPEFTPDASNKTASNITTTEWHDIDVLSDTEYYYLVRATDVSSGKQERNVLKVSDTVEGEISNGIWSAGAEIGDTGFNQANKHVGWEQSTARKNSGERSYWSQNNSSTCSALTTQTLELTAGEQSTLDFWTAYDMDFQFDGGIVEVSTFTNDWQSVELAPDYPNQFRLSNDSCGYEAGEKSFTGSDLKWQKHSLDLSEFQGQNIKLRWNYSSDVVNNGEGWFIDDISISNVQVHSQCQTILPTVQPQPGLWYDLSRNGHGFVVEPIGVNNLYFTVFYTYDDEGNPEWYTSLATFENGVLNVNLESDTLQRSIYDFSINPIGAGTPNIIDNSIGTNILSIDFNSDTLRDAEACNDGVNRSENIALASWQLGDQLDTWCIEPLIAQDNYPTPDFGGTWWTGNDDTGWGLSLAFANDTIIAIIYYYDAQGNPRWVIGQKAGFAQDQEITFDLLEVHGFARDAIPTETSSVIAGTISLILNSNSHNLGTDGIMNIDVTYKGTEGGTWTRSNMPVTNFTQAH